MNNYMWFFSLSTHLIEIATDFIKGWKSRLTRDMVEPQQPHDFQNQFFDATRFFLRKFFWVLWLVSKLIIPAQLITNNGRRYYFHLFFQYCRTPREKESPCQAPFLFPLAYTARQEVETVSLPFFPPQGLIPQETKMKKRYMKYLMRITDTEEKTTGDGKLTDASELVVRILRILHSTLIKQALHFFPVEHLSHRYWAVLWKPSSKLKKS